MDFAVEFIFSSILGNKKSAGAEILPNIADFFSCSLEKSEKPAVLIRTMKKLDSKTILSIPKMPPAILLNMPSITRLMSVDKAFPLMYATP